MKFDVWLLASPITCLALIAVNTVLLCKRHLSSGVLVTHRSIMETQVLHRLHRPQIFAAFVVPPIMLVHQIVVSAIPFPAYLSLLGSQVRDLIITMPLHHHRLLGNSRGTSTVDVDVENMTMPNRALRTLRLRFSVDVES